MGTVFSFDIRDAPTRAVRHALDRAVAWLHQVDEVFSTYRPGSQISRLSRGEITLADCDRDVAEVLWLCENAERLTDGWFSRAPGGRLDPTGLVKGWAIERASVILERAGARNTCVNGGGDVQLRGECAPGVPWRVGIACPARPGQLCALVTGRDLAVATSGTAERGAHILDPHTGRPADSGLLSITLVGRHLTDIDVCATAAFAMGPRARAWVESLPGVEAFAVTSDSHTWWTRGFPGVAGSSSSSVTWPV
ncbi:ApbE family lipoprotein [Streptomyces viridochromogenes DSM 40736]|uniref:FAD:protein FMN transferase n=1 Tax=Streptomyces viridochromogenes (strain DSM 40736 / JCM 4977 / BCRC 1201 / Tue 494) TaxID=591159 RepID=D9X7M3_STRVT|nr:FAD:protein FMN transferase [Streptomyces viridochromogenes]EFL29919.1 ApbE family lipoprotein [Streptomyces viridochromogenes DSM 40736]